MTALENRGRAGRGVSEAAEKLANMKIGPRRPTMQQQQRPPPMKAGGRWIGGEPGNLYLRPVQEVHPVRPYARKVAG